MVDLKKSNCKIKRDKKHKKKLIKKLYYGFCFLYLGILTYFIILALVGYIFNKLGLCICLY